MIRWGLCCIFESGEPRTRGTTIKKQKTIPHGDRMPRLMEIVHHNMWNYLPQAIVKCRSMGVHNFRVSANVFPCMTHHEEGYRFESMPQSIFDGMAHSKYIAYTLNVRLTFHHNHFIVLGSEDEGIAQRSLNEVIEIAKFCWLTGISTTIVHCSGTGDKQQMLDRIVERVNALDPATRSYLAFENDHNKCTPRDAIYVAERTGCRFVYDVHHHRLNPDDMSIGEATEACKRLSKPYGIEPLFHISSPHAGWDGPKPFHHSQIINPSDFPEEWMQFHNNPDNHATIEVETKLRETALTAIMAHFQTLQEVPHATDVHRS